MTFDVKLPYILESVGRCRSCQAPIAWCRHEHTLKMSPLNPDGTSHFATCPDARAWRGRHRG